MKEYILENDLKLIYRRSDSELTSICIAVDAGAGVENEKYGIAHAAEHMVYKGTKNRNEKEINEGLSNVFGFNNAMTNYPYVIYYGTLLKEDLEKGLDLLSDIVINPSFKEFGFEEEMAVIKEELREWDEELEQYCEDKLFFNSFESRRIKYPIIGTEESLNNITLKEIREFYEMHYFPGNTSIVIVSSLEFEQVKAEVNKYFGGWRRQSGEKQDRNRLERYIKYEALKPGEYNDKREGIKTCRVEIIFPIDSLSEKEMKCLKIFNQYFGEGVNSVLYDTLRTKNGLIYDVITNVAYENYIKLYKISFNTSKENVDKAIKLVKECIQNISNLIYKLDEKQLNQLFKSFKLKRLFREEQSIVLAKELATYDCMFGDYNIYINETEDLNKITSEKIVEVTNKVLNNMTIQIINKA
ncbi:putative Zn-dependent peptidase [Clostridium saccharoperbutylacetonicum]|uniref:Putative Zn-dependent peptidase n=1 Tax=Clostridium saccharoperbutylacetonicum N1-4(HMT) TaxID=931276 RepID=M1MKR4_9CLOT|nr:pitrilysin family protein [Clostridium saccharoperbutylacetonicum]AGF55406.1 putative Zn-dependent peptidase [Clostridium saccharoperbutylacetonicum N1-4(HMT)]NRT63880.1 putative Zn-dependent peptidase [Clostridium saccharoperbutylacetonicum]NSB27245.1 putative Zn-dependent peptidase [Clostridium saccharoperbutylacetonicum]NSB40732.1 putative Zn-dependent peptidase [Clostridium saccharoperbutylacetonicum]